MVLVDSDRVAAEFTRLLVGQDRPVRGRLLIDGLSPRNAPAIRVNIASLLAREDFSFSETVQGAVDSVAALRRISPSVGSVLSLLGLEGLATRATRTLSSNESRQVATALALAQIDAHAAIFCEPLLALNQQQTVAFQQQLSILASRACVLCLTSSLHDARMLGGPHAQLSARGWTALESDSLKSTRLRVHIEGPSLRQLASELALHAPLARLTLQTGNQSQDKLELIGSPADVSTSQIVRMARRGLTSISRMFVRGIGNLGPEAVAPGGSPTLVKAEPTTTNRGMNFYDLRLCAVAQLHLVARARSTLAGWATLLLLPSIATVYATLLRSREGSWASYDALIFLGTVLAPLWSLILCRLMYADHILGSGVETLARYGAGRRGLAVNRLLAVSLVNAALAALSAGLVCATGGWVALAHGELISAMWITGMGGAVYGAIVVGLTDASRSHWVRWAFILLDFLMGGTSRAISFPFPRAHLHNLLGSATAIEFPQRGSCTILGILLFLAIGLTAARTEP